jgi:hypothetical protein
MSGMTWRSVLAAVWLVAVFAAYLWQLRDALVQ